MTRYSKIWIAALSLITMALVGCTNEEDLGGRTPVSDGRTPNGDGESSANASDASTSSSPDSGNKDSGGANLFGKTAAGESCSPADYPPAPVSCAIAGTYTVTENWCQGGACGDTLPNPSSYQWVANVTVNGTEVKLTNGNDRLLKCQLETACDCRHSGGTLTRFLSGRFIRLGGWSQCQGTPDGKHYRRDVGVKL